MHNPVPRLSDRYVLDQPIAKGAHGSLWRAYDRSRHMDVIVKFPLGSPDWARRRTDVLRQEVELASRVAHPNVVKMVGFHEKPIPHLTMEEAPGRNLAKRGPLPVALVTRIGSQVASALSAVHRAGVVHRDVSPRNLILSESGLVVLSDFGSAAPMDTKTEDLQGYDRAEGYAAPELYAAQGSQRGTAAADVYGLGATMYELITGRKLFGSRFRQFAGDTPSWENTPYPSELTSLVTQMVQKDPKSRPATGEVRERLAAVPRTTSSQSGAAGLGRVARGPRLEPGQSGTGSSPAPAPAHRARERGPKLRRDGPGGGLSREP